MIAHVVSHDDLVLIAHLRLKVERSAENGRLTSTARCHIHFYVMIQSPVIKVLDIKPPLTLFSLKNSTPPKTPGLHSRKNDILLADNHTS